MKSHVFCKPERNKSVIWSTDNLDSCLEDHSLLHLKAEAHRTIYKHIADRHFIKQLSVIDMGIGLDHQS